VTTDTYLPPAEQSRDVMEESDEPLASIDLEAVDGETVDATALDAALASTDPTVRQRGVRVCTALAATDLDAVAEHTDGLTRLLADDSTAVATTAGTALRPIAERRPAALAEYTDRVVAAIETDGDVRQTVTAVLSPLVVERPTAVAPHVAQLVAALTADDGEGESSSVPETVTSTPTRRTIRHHEAVTETRDRVARQTLANVVVAAAEADPDAVDDDALDGMTTLLSDDDAVVAGAAAAALGVVAEADPDAVAPAVPALVASLDYDDTTVRVRAIRTLGFVGDETAVSPLRTVAEEDPDADVRALAGETATFLADD
jgi:hypothetical protein